MGMRKKKINFPDGSKYVGEVKNGKPHGIGKIKYFDGATYSGNWKYGKYFGKGKINFINNNDWYSMGLYYNDYEEWSKSVHKIKQLNHYKKFYNQMHGYGKILKVKNFNIDLQEIYELNGIWKDNYIIYGTKKDKDWFKYVGEFKNNIGNGNGKEIWNYKKKRKFSRFPYSGFTGKYKKGKWHGKGVHIETDNHEYYYLGKTFEKKRVKGDRIVAEWIGKWKNGFEIGNYIVNVYYFNPKQKLKFKRVIDVKYNKKGGTPKRRISYWQMRD